MTRICDFTVMNFGIKMNLVLEPVWAPQCRCYDQRIHIFIHLKIQTLMNPIWTKQIGQTFVFFIFFINLSLKCLKNWWKPIRWTAISSYRSLKWRWIIWTLKNSIKSSMKEVNSTTVELISMQQQLLLRLRPRSLSESIICGLLNFTSEPETTVKAALRRRYHWKQVVLKQF